LPIFLGAIGWGNKECTTDAKIRFHWSALLNSKELPHILRRWSKPPRPSGSKTARPKGTKQVMQDFAIECSLEVLEKELENLVQVFKSPAGLDVTEEQLT
ncbi:hypothetical protein B0H10DRAFT_1726066, partial [Mycena sp. CBHHK59/15]